MPRKRRIPRLCHHKASGRAVVRLNGQDHYCGRWDTEQAQQEYDRLIKEWLGNHRTLPEPEPENEDDRITLVEVIDAFWSHAQTYYRNPGNWRLLLRTLDEMYGDLPAEEFGPVKLRAVMQAFVQRGSCRQYVNKQMHRVRRVFKWGVAHELIDNATYERLKTVEALEKGRCEAPEGRKVSPVDQVTVDATLAELKPMLADMVRIQQLLGCRPQELCIMRPCDVERKSDVWLYVPESHKTEHLEIVRIIPIGPKAQMLLARYLLRAADQRCFPIKRQSYAQAIGRGAERAKVERWQPNQLRHSRATQVRKEFGLEAVTCLLGHTQMKTSEIYAEKNLQLAVEVARLTG